MEMKAPRGVRDILPEESWKWNYVINIAAKTMADYGFAEVHLPIFEHTELFSRGVGETTDIVEKEMYTFEDRGGRSITLRPEATAGMVRAVLENNLCAQNADAKLWCWGPMFRHERPQKGRYRQFYQVDCEHLGCAGAANDVEIIDLAAEIFRRLGLKNLEAVINSVGCPKCRPVYREALINYFNNYKDKLCETCLDRLDRNPLRILDCKQPECGRIADGAPDIYDSLCEECREHFEEVKRGLERLGIAYKINKRLVRGLDYYTKTAFEILSGDLGAQNAVCGGGRYDNLSESIGGPHLPSVGFACGVDRIILVMEQQGLSFGAKPGAKVYVAALDASSRGEAQVLTHKLRSAGIAAQCDNENRSFKSQLKAASLSNVKFACILGPDEIKNNIVTLKNMAEGSQISLNNDELVEYIRNNLE
ncbi:MAG: histidine--tRNA ligase [Synergistaceae bacterium]|nr:histidine--tRNA ligase [Synergistaceae bacterium]